MKRDVESLTTGLTYHGRVEGKRQRSFVLSDPRRYFVMSLSRSKRGVPSALAALNMLHVLVATGRASIDQRRSAARELFFDVPRG